MEKSQLTGSTEFRSMVTVGRPAGRPTRASGQSVAVRLPHGREDPGLHGPDPPSRVSSQSSNVSALTHRLFVIVKEADADNGSRDRTGSFHILAIVRKGHRAVEATAYTRDPGRTIGGA